MNRRQFLQSTVAVATVAGAAGISILTRPGRALAYRPLTNYGDGDGESKSKGKGKHRKRRGNGK